VRGKVVIIGGGITGLAAAYRLQQIAPEVEIILIEASERLGGKIGSERFEGFLIEAGPDCFLSRKPRGIGLCEELGVTAELQGRDPAHRKTYVLRHGRLHRLPEGLTGMIPTNLDALRHSTLLSDQARERIAQEPILPPAPDNGDESVANFICRRFGRETFENLIEPLMGGIYAGQADQLSLAATFPQLRQLELKHGSLINGLLAQKTAASSASYPPFVAFRDGMGELVNHIVDRLKNVQICLRTAVSHIDIANEGYQLTLQPTNLQSPISNLHTPILILTTPTYVTSHLLHPIAPDLALTLDQIPYASSALVNLAFNEADISIPLDGYGYVIPRIEGRAALACTWTSRKWRGRAPAGKVLLRVYIGRFGEPDVTSYADEKLLAIAQQEISDTLQIQVEPLFHRIVRFPKAMPQYNMGHLDRLATIETRLKDFPGLFMSGAAFRGVGIPDCIHAGETAARAAVAYWQEMKSRE
jgi:oxygen-dependent protoporphyrinogen oxidase